MYHDTIGRLYLRNGMYILSLYVHVYLLHYCQQGIEWSGVCSTNCKLYSQLLANIDLLNTFSLHVSVCCIKKLNFVYWE